MHPRPVNYCSRRTSVSSPCTTSMTGIRPNEVSLANDMVARCYFKDGIFQPFNSSWKDTGAMSVHTFPSPSHRIELDWLVNLFRIDMMKTNTMPTTEKVPYVNQDGLILSGHFLSWITTYKTLMCHFQTNLFNISQIHPKEYGVLENRST